MRYELTCEWGREFPVAQGETRYTLNDVADILGVSQRTVRRWVHQGNLPAELRPGHNGPQYFIAGGSIAAVEDRSRRPKPMVAPEEVEALGRQLAELSSRVESLQQQHLELQALTAELLDGTSQAARIRGDVAKFRTAAKTARMQRALRRSGYEDTDSQQQG